MDKKENKFKSALHVNDGIEQPPSVSEDAVKKFKRIKHKILSADDYFTGIRKGDITILSKAITLIESAKPEHHNLAQKIIEKSLPYTGNSIRIGVTGVPGVGKSTFIEALGKKLTEQDEKIAVLAIDPSSERSKGSILGDKTRMELLAADKNAFIRPSPSAGTLGGVAQKTRETIFLCEAAGYKTIFIETVGVGQSEIAVHSMVDFFLLLMLAGAGDELQGIKRGIMEMADMLVVTKADGDNIRNSEIARAEYEKALHYLPMQKSGIVPKALICSSLKDQGVDNMWQEALSYINQTKSNGYFQDRRNEQARYWMYETINSELKASFYNNPSLTDDIKHYERMVLENKTSSFIAANELLKKYRIKK